MTVNLKIVNKTGEQNKLKRTKTVIFTTTNVQVKYRACARTIVNVLSTDLFAVAHGTLSSDHNFTAGVLFNLFGGHTARTKDSTYEVELQQSSELKMSTALS